MIQHLLLPVTLPEAVSAQSRDRSGGSMAGAINFTFDSGASASKWSEIRSFESTTPEHSKFQAKNFPCSDSQVFD